MAYNAGVAYVAKWSSRTLSHEICIHSLIPISIRRLLVRNLPQQAGSISISVTDELLTIFPNRTLGIQFSPVLKSCPQILEI